MDNAAVAFNEVLWKRIAGENYCEAMSVISQGKGLHVLTVGGNRKVEKLKYKLREFGISPQSVIYFGDGKSDVEAFRLINESKGLAVSVNGNEPAVRNASIAVRTDNGAVIAVIANIFVNKGPAEVKSLVGIWPKLYYYYPNSLIEEIGLRAGENLKNVCAGAFRDGEVPIVNMVTGQNVNWLIKLSGDFRKVKIAKLC